jgi:hypothetical protein
METEPNFSPVRLILSAALKSIPAAVRGGISFAIVVFIFVTLLRIGSYLKDFSLNRLSETLASNDLGYSMIMAPFGLIILGIVFIIFAMPPAFVAGILASILIYWGIRRECLTEKRSLYVGMMLGGSVTLMFCICVTSASFYFGPGHGMNYSISNFDWLGYSFYTILAVSIAAIAGGSTAKNIFRDMKRKMFEQ